MDESYTYFEEEKKFPRNIEDVKKLIGKRIEFVLHRDIDNTGRGLFRTNTGKVTDVFRKSVLIGIEWYSFKEISHYRIIQHTVNSFYYCENLVFHMVIIETDEKKAIEVFEKVTNEKATACKEINLYSNDAKKLAYRGNLILAEV
jgi:hypothetical protein